jgi:hypothetical protein
MGANISRLTKTEKTPIMPTAERISFTAALSLLDRRDIKDVVSATICGAGITRCGSCPLCRRPGSSLALRLVFYRS